MLARFPFAAALLAVTASLTSVACGGAEAPRGEEESEQPESAEDELSTSCTYPRRYFATVREGSCEVVEGKRGRWVPEPLFADMPEELASSSCIYRWHGERYARVDRDALRAAYAQNTWPTRGVITPACGSATRPDVGDLDPIPNIDNLGHAGSVGCDVCGIVRRGKVWVILPPEKIGLRQFQVQLSNGAYQAYQIQAPDGARAISMELPAPPAGAEFTEGRIWVF